MLAYQIMVLFLIYRSVSTGITYHLHLNYWTPALCVPMLSFTSLILCTWISSNFVSLYNSVPDQVCSMVFKYRLEKLNTSTQVQLKQIKFNLFLVDSHMHVTNIFTCSGCHTGGASSQTTLLNICRPSGDGANWLELCPEQLIGIY
jgi:hypothetical protein